jgi:hypothetical protein
MELQLFHLHAFLVRTGKTKASRAVLEASGSVEFCNLCGVWSQRIHVYLTHYAILATCRKVNVRLISSAVSCVGYFY